MAMAMESNKIIKDRYIKFPSFGYNRSLRRHNVCLSSHLSQPYLWPRMVFCKIQKPEIKILVFGSVKEPKESLCPSVRVKVLSRSLNHHLSLSGVSQVYLRSL